MCSEEAECQPQTCPDTQVCECCGQRVCEDALVADGLCRSCYYGPCRRCGSELCFGNFTGICDEGSEVKLDGNKTPA